jgi:hypothetical protein
VNSDSANANEDALIASAAATNLKCPTVNSLKYKIIGENPDLPISPSESLE